MKTIKCFSTLFLFFCFIIFNGCKEDNTTQPTDNNTITPQTTAPDAYIPVKAGINLKYKITFPATVNLPYRPIIEYPEGLLASSITHGMLSWSQGVDTVTIRTTTIAESTATLLSYEISLNQTAYKFFFAMTGNYHAYLRKKVSGGAFTYDFVAEIPVAVPGWKIARRVCVIRSDSLNTKANITTPAGTFNDCIRIFNTLSGDGIYVPSGTYVTEMYFSKDKGLIKAIGWNTNGTIAYTMELI